MATIKQDIKENFRNSMEQNTGIVGQVLKDRREKQIHEKEVDAELSQINIKTTRLKNDGRAFKKIEVSTIQISENLQIINKWADAQVTTQEETHQALEQQQEAAQQQKLPKISIPDSKEDGSIFDNILDLFDKMGKKIKTRFPKGLKRGARTVFDATKRLIRNPAVRSAALKGTVGIAALTYSESLNKNEDKELEERRKQAPTITPPKEEPAAYGNEQRRVKQAAPAPEAPAYGNEQRRVKQTAPAPVVTPEALQKLAVPTPAPAPLPPPPAPIPPPTAAVPAPPAPTPKPPKAPTAAPIPAAVSAPPPSATPAGSSVPALSSVVKVKSDASIDGINSELAKRVATMAVAFKKETGKQLTINSGIRTNEEQKQLYDAKVAELKGDEKTARGVVAEPMAPLGRGKGSLHFKERGGLALDIEPNYPDGLNKLAGTQKEPTGWLEKFGLIRPVQKYNKLKQRWEEDWHVQLASTPPVGDDGIVAGKGGVPVDLNSGKSLPIPVNPNTGEKLLDSSKTVEQLKKDQNARGTQTVIMTETTNKTDYEKKKKPQGQTTAAVG